MRRVRRVAGAVSEQRAVYSEVTASRELRARESWDAWFPSVRMRGSNCL
jgi:hypothetical protein